MILHKKYKVSSLVDYIKLSKKLNMDEYILRGQIEPFQDISASAFRIYKGSFSNCQIYDYTKLLKAYYNAVCTTLTSEEKENFIAFSQHHSLPTNLVDFTNSPLISLFFSCYNKQALSFTVKDLIHKDDKKSIVDLSTNDSTQMMLIHNLINALEKNDYTGKNSVVYLIRKDKTMDITDILKQENCFDFYDSISTDKTIQKLFFEKLSDFFKNNYSKIKPNILNIMKATMTNEYSCYYKDSGNFFRKAYNKYKNNFFTLQDLYVNLIENLANESIAYGFIFDEHMVYEDELAARIYLGLLIQLLEIVRDSNGYTESDYATLELDLYFTYSPPLMFDRIKNQNGIFIYQPFLFLSDSTYDFNILVKQSIKPDITIEIENCTEILNDLDNISINPSFVFSDYDNVATTLKNKFILK